MGAASSSDNSGESDAAAALESGAESRRYNDAVSRLLSTSISRMASAEWSQLWEWPKCAEDVWTRFSFPLLRTLRTRNAYNLAALIVRCLVYLPT